MNHCLSLRFRTPRIDRCKRKGGNLAIRFRQLLTVLLFASGKIGLEIFAPSQDIRCLADRHFGSLGNEMIAFSREMTSENSHREEKIGH